VLEPFLRGDRVRGTGPKNRLRIAGRVDQTLDMAAVGELKRTPLSIELRGIVASLPRRNVVSHAGNHVAIHVYFPHVQRLSEDLKLTSIDERIDTDQIEEVGV
jgi:hypothetical protein